MLNLLPILTAGGPAMFPQAPHRPAVWMQTVAPGAAERQKRPGWTTSRSAPVARAACNHERP
jgi:hypothetical protein